MSTNSMNTNSIFRAVSFGALVLVCISMGCVKPGSDVAEKKDKPEPILGKETQEIGEFNPDANRKLRDDKEGVNMVNSTMRGASHAIHEIARLQIKQSVEMFRAVEGRYPKSHEEFMEKVIKANGIKLPAPVTTAEYQYDVENHELLVVEKQE